MNTQDSHLPAALQGLRIPLIASPLFIISVPKLVIAQCKAGLLVLSPRSMRVKARVSIRCSTPG